MDEVFHRICSLICSIFDGQCASVWRCSRISSLLCNLAEKLSNHRRRSSNRSSSVSEVWLADVRVRLFDIENEVARGISKNSMVSVVVYLQLFLSVDLVFKKKQN